MPAVRPTATTINSATATKSFRSEHVPVPTRPPRPPAKRTPRATRTAVEELAAKQGDGVVAYVRSAVTTAVHAAASASHPPCDGARQSRAIKGVEQERPHREGVRAGANEDVDRFLGRADHRLAVDVEAGVEHDAGAPAHAGFAQQIGELAGLIFSHDLRPAGAVDADHSGQAVPETRRHFVRHRHARIRPAVPVGEETCRVAFEHRGTERLIPHAPLEHEVQAIAKVGPVRPREHAAMTERSGPVSMRP